MSSLLRAVQRDCDRGVFAPKIATWLRATELQSLCANAMTAQVRRQRKPLGVLQSLSFAPDEIPLTPNHPLLEPGRDCTIRWESNGGRETGPLLCESELDGQLIFAHPLGPLPPKIDRTHPTVNGEWKMIRGKNPATGEEETHRIWRAAHKVNDDASKVSGPHPDPATRSGYTPDPKYAYGAVTEEDPAQTLSQYHGDGVTPLVASRQVPIGSNGHSQTLFLCQPVIQLKYRATGNTIKNRSIVRVDTRADRTGRQMAFLFPLLTGGLHAAPAFLVYGEWRLNTREDGN